LIRFGKFLFAVLAAVAALVFSPVSQAQTQANNSSGNVAQQAQLKIGFSLASYSERWQTDLDSFQKRAKALGADVVSSFSGDDDDKQFEQVKQMLDSGIQVLVLIPHTVSKGIRIVEAARAKHVKVICYDSLVRDSDVDLYVGFDAHAIGRMQAQFLVEHAPKGNYVTIEGDPGDKFNNAEFVWEGQMEVLKPYIDRGDIKIVADTWSKDWSRADAYVHMLEAIDKSHGDIVAVVASADGLADGAIQALTEQRLAGKVLITGQDADLGGIIRILDGTQTMTIYKPLSSAAGLAAEAAVKLAKNEPLSTKGALDNGKKKVPAILLPLVVVTKDNVSQTVIKDGFQSLDAIKQALPKEKWPK
jgi:D-xylose transport system substrate-binding protein